MYNRAEYFLGDWKISRLCYTTAPNNSPNQQRDSFRFEGKGTATFRKSANSNQKNSGYTVLQYQENVTLDSSITKDSDKIQGKQEYRYVFNNGNVSKFNKSSPGNLFVYNKMFDLNYKYPTNEEEELLDFIEQEIADAYAEGSYKCGNDDYLCKIYFKSGNEFKITYEVSGPEKNYVTISEFKKCQAEDIPIDLSGDVESDSI